MSINSQRDMNDIIAKFNNMIDIVLSLYKIWRLKVDDSCVPIVDADEIQKAENFIDVSRIASEKIGHYQNLLSVMKTEFVNDVTVELDDVVEHFNDIPARYTVRYLVGSHEDALIAEKCKELESAIIDLEVLETDIVPTLFKNRLSELREKVSYNQFEETIISGDFYAGLSLATNKECMEKLGYSRTKVTLIRNAFVHGNYGNTLLKGMSKKAAGKVLFEIQGNNNFTAEKLLLESIIEDRDVPSNVLMQLYAGEKRWNDAICLFNAFKDVLQEIQAARLVYLEALIFTSDKSLKSYITEYFADYLTVIAKLSHVEKYVRETTLKAIYEKENSIFNDSFFSRLLELSSVLKNDFYKALVIQDDKLREFVFDNRYLSKLGFTYNEIVNIQRRYSTNDFETGSTLLDVIERLKEFIGNKNEVVNKLQLLSDSTLFSVCYKEIEELDNYIEAENLVEKLIGLKANNDFEYIKFFIVTNFDKFLEWYSKRELNMVLSIDGTLTLEDMLLIQHEAEICGAMSVVLYYYFNFGIGDYAVQANEFHTFREQQLEKLSDDERKNYQRKIFLVTNNDIDENSDIDFIKPIRNILMHCSDVEKCAKNVCAILKNANINKNNFDSLLNALKNNPVCYVREVIDIINEFASNNYMDIKVLVFYHELRNQVGAKESIDVKDFLYEKYLDALRNGYLPKALYEDVINYCDVWPRDAHSIACRAFIYARLGKSLYAKTIISFLVHRPSTTIVKALDDLKNFYWFYQPVESYSQIFMKVVKDLTIKEIDEFLVFSSRFFVDCAGINYITIRDYKLNDYYRDDYSKRLMHFCIISDLDHAWVNLKEYHNNQGLEFPIKLFVLLAERKGKYWEECVRRLFLDLDIDNEELDDLLVYSFEKWINYSPNDKEALSIMIDWAGKGPWSKYPKLVNYVYHTLTKYMVGIEIDEELMDVKWALFLLAKAGQHFGNTNLIEHYENYFGENKLESIDINVDFEIPDFAQKLLVTEVSEYVYTMFGDEAVESDIIVDSTSKLKNSLLHAHDNNVKFLGLLEYALTLYVFCNTYNKEKLAYEYVKKVLCMPFNNDDNVIRCAEYNNLIKTLVQSKFLQKLISSHKSLRKIYDDFNEYKLAYQNLTYAFQEVEEVKELLTAVYGFIEGLDRFYNDEFGKSCIDEVLLKSLNDNYNFITNCQVNNNTDWQKVKEAVLLLIRDARDEMMAKPDLTLQIFNKDCLPRKGALCGIIENQGRKDLANNVQIQIWFDNISTDKYVIEYLEAGGRGYFEIAYDVQDIEFLGDVLNATVEIVYEHNGISMSVNKKELISFCHKAVPVITYPNNVYDSQGSPSFRYDKIHKEVYATGFYGRREETAKLRALFQGEYFGDYSSAIVHGERRTGKTTLMNYLKAYIDNCVEDAMCLKFDIQELTKTIQEAFINRIIDSPVYSDFTDERLDNFFRKWRELPNGQKDRNPSELKKFYIGLRRLTGKGIIVIMDEFDSLLNELALEAGSVDRLFNSLTSMIEDPDCRESVHFVFCGSNKLIRYEKTGGKLQQFFQKLGNNKFEVGRLGKNEIYDLLNAVTQKYSDIRYSDESLKVIWEYTEGSVWFVKLIGNAAIERLKDKGRGIIYPYDIVHVFPEVITKQNCQQFEECCAIGTSEREIIDFIAANSNHRRIFISKNKMYRDLSRVMSKYDIDRCLETLLDFRIIERSYTANDEYGFSAELYRRFFRSEISSDCMYNIQPEIRPVFKKLKNKKKIKRMSWE